MVRFTFVLNCLRSGGAEKQLLWVAGEVSSRGYACKIFEITAGERVERHRGARAL